MNTSTEHILQCNQSEPLADCSGRIVDLMNENGSNCKTRRFKWHSEVLLKGLTQAKIIKKSVILFWLINMTI